MTKYVPQPGPTPYPPNVADEPRGPAIDHVYPKAKTKNVARPEGAKPAIKRGKRKQEAKPFGPPAPLAVPEEPLVTYDASGLATGCTPAGLQVVHHASAEGFAQVSIATSLGLSLKVFERLLGRADAEPMSDVRAAWELGQGDLRSELVRLCLAGARRGGMVQSLFLLKSLFQFRDQGPAVAVDNSSRVQFVLPGPLSESEYYAKLGIKEPIDTRPMDQRKSAAELMDVARLPAPNQDNMGE